MELKSLVLEEDLKEKAKRELVAHREDLRKERIFNAKQRQIGVDVDALAEQVTEKRIRERLNEIENERFALVRNKIANEAIKREQEIEMERKRIERELELYRKTFQKKQMSRDYDLEMPDDSTKCSANGVTHFEGEDLNLKDRVAHQKRQQQNWLTQQILEKNMERFELKRADKEFEGILKSRLDTLTSLENMEKRCKREVERAVSDFNRSLSARNKLEREQKSSEERKNDETDIYNCLTSDLLLENPELAKSTLGSNRFNSMMFKGMSVEQRNEIRKAQLDQIEEAKAKRWLEERETKMWETYNASVQNTVHEVDERTGKALRDRDRMTKEYNKMLSEDQKSRRAYVNNVVMANSISQDFFDYFNKTPRKNQQAEDEIRTSVNERLCSFVQ